MVRQSVRAILALVLFVPINYCQAVPHMEAGKMPLKIALSPQELKDARSIVALQWLELKAGPELLYSTTQSTSAQGLDYETSIFAVGTGEAGQQPSPLFVVSQLLPPPPHWQATTGSLGTPALVYESALGATYAVMVRISKQPETDVTSKYPLESFTRPRFVKGGQDDPTRAVTAIADEKSAVLFVRGENGVYEKRAKLCDCSDAVMMKYAGDWLVFYKTIVPGLVRGNLIRPGALHYIKLGANFLPAGPPLEPLPGSVVFDFDVAASADKIAILATTKAGTILARGASLGEPLIPAAFEEAGQGELVSSPALLVTGSHIRVAMLEGAKTDGARVLTGSIPVD